MARHKLLAVLFTQFYNRLVWKGVDKWEAFVSVREIFKLALPAGFRLPTIAWRRSPELQRLRHFVQLRENRMPLQYIVEEWPFRDIMLKMKPPVLIVRPETELLIDVVIQSITNCTGTFLDIGCGSGAIAISLLRQYPLAHAVGIDKLVEAVSLSEENAVRIGVQQRLSVTCIEFTDFVRSNTQMFDFIVTNPPYIRTQLLPSLSDEIYKYESHVALDGGSDGLNLIKKILLSSPFLLKHNGPRMLFLEIGFDQYPEIQKFVRNSGLNVVSIDAVEDHQGHLRFLTIKYR